MLNDIIHGAGVFIIELIKLLPLMLYVIGYKAKPFKKILIYTLSAFTAVVLCCFIWKNEAVSLCAVISLIYTISILDGKSKFSYTVIIYFGICIFDMLVASVMLLFVDYSYEQMNDSTSLNLIANSINIAFILSIILITAVIRRKKKHHSEKINLVYLLLVLVGEISILIFITVFQYMDSSNKLLAVILCFGGVAFIIITAVMIINHISQKYYKKNNEINTHLLEIQEKYYTMLLKKDRETVKFRHDINKHINCMYQMFKNKKYNELDEYFKEIGISLTELKSAVQTGNDMINAMLNDNLNKYPQVKCIIEGTIPNKLSLSNMELCTIFSNLFDNAFSAADKSGLKEVEISFKFAGPNLLCRIENTVNRKVEITDNVMQTEKDDKINHGYGTENARLCAEANEGSLTYQCSNEYFTAELVLPAIQ